MGLLADDIVTGDECFAQPSGGQPPLSWQKEQTLRPHAYDVICCLISLSESNFVLVAAI